MNPVIWLSVLLLLAAVVLLVLQLAHFSRVRAAFPAGLQIAGIPVGGLERQQTAQRLLEAYTLPVELHYGESLIQLDPAVIEYELDLETMLTAADLEREGGSFWTDFWNFLWEVPKTPGSVPLRASYSETRLRNYLQNEISLRYDKPPTPAQPAVGTTNFLPGESGTTLDVDLAVQLIDSALRSPNLRAVDLPLARTQASRPSMFNLETLLKQTIDLTEFDGVIAVYLYDVQTAQEFYFLRRQGQDLTTIPDLAFTAASIIKIPIMVSAFRNVDNPDQEMLDLIFLMIDKSDNIASDLLMDAAITTPTRAGPLGVTDDMETLGLPNTFLAGYFYDGAPLLRSITTAANSRTDVLTEPDLYNQTTPTEIGMLLTDIYTCAETGGGNLIAAFPGEITQSECQIMIQYLLRNKIAVLFEAGVPDGTKIAHKHGWVSDILAITRTIGDAGIIYTPGGNVVLVIFMNHPVQLIWEPSAQLFADLTRAVYNYYNLSSP